MMRKTITILLMGVLIAEVGSASELLDYCKRKGKNAVYNVGEKIHTFLDKGQDRIDEIPGCL